MEELQEDRQDHVDHAIHDLLCDLAGQDLGWDIELIGEVRDVIQHRFTERGIMPEYEFYPWDELVDDKPETTAQSAAGQDNSDVSE